MKLANKKIGQNGILLFLVIILLFSGHAFAESNSSENKTAVFSEKALAAKVALENSLLNIGELKKAGFGTTRALDTYDVAEKLFLAQVSYEEKSGIGSGSYDNVLQKTNEIREFKAEAFRVNDELKVLLSRIEKSGKTVNLSEAKEIYSAALDDLKNERYEGTREKIDSAYAKISEIESAYSRAAVLIAAAKSLKEKIISSWKEILIVTAAILFFVLLTYKKILVYLYAQRIKHLELERKILENLIESTQDSYFNKGAISESAYHIRVTKYGDLIREINRQIPLLYNEIEKVQKSVLKKESEQKIIKKRTAKKHFTKHKITKKRIIKKHFVKRKKATGKIRKEIRKGKR